MISLGMFLEVRLLESRLSIFLRLLIHHVNLLAIKLYQLSTRCFGVPASPHLYLISSKKKNI